MNKKYQQQSAYVFIIKNSINNNKMSTQKHNGKAAFHFEEQFI